MLCGPHGVRDLLVEGRPVVRAGRLTGVELADVLARARARVARLLSGD